MQQESQLGVSGGAGFEVDRVVVNVACAGGTLLYFLFAGCLDSTAFFSICMQSV